MTVGRFAPTPSGRMHLGNVLCAMLSWLSVRARGGRYLLRIEDLDAMRCPRALADQIEDDLRWFGLDWDDGGSDGGAQWYQSTRAPVYDRYFAELTRRGWCTRAFAAGRSCTRRRRRTVRTAPMSTRAPAAG